MRGIVRGERECPYSLSSYLQYTTIYFVKYSTIEWLVLDNLNAVVVVVVVLELMELTVAATDMDQHDGITVAEALVDNIADDASIVAADSHMTNSDYTRPCYNSHTDHIAWNFVTNIDFASVPTADIAVDDNKTDNRQRSAVVDKLKLIAYYFYQFPRTHKRRQALNDTYSMAFVWAVE